jgi:hypothetical protein
MSFANNFARNHEKNNTWNIRRLVNDSFFPSSKQPSVLYCTLMGFMKYILYEAHSSRNSLLYIYN